MYPHAVHTFSDSVRYQLRRGLAQLLEWPIAQLDDLRVHRLALPLLLLELLEGLAPLRRALSRLG